VIVEKLKENRMMVIAAFAYLVAFLYDSEIFLQACQLTWGYIVEMLQVMPAVFVVASLVTVWVPPEVIMRNFGGESGLKGKLASILVGSVSAGPIYAAFPIAQSLLHKGASLSNVVIIISAWAVVKLPMLIVETRFLGIQFAAVRYIFTVPGLLVIGMLTSRYLTRKEVLEDAQLSVAREGRQKSGVMDELPGYDCGACGFPSCVKCAEAMLRGEADASACKIIDEDAQEQLNSILSPAGSCDV